MKSPGLELCSHHVSLCTGIRSSKYKCLINVQLFTFITESLNKLYIGLFVAISSNSLKINNFLESILFSFFLEIQTIVAALTTSASTTVSFDFSLKTGNALSGVRSHGKRDRLKNRCRKF